MVDRVKNNRVLIRDLAIFQLKLFLDGLADLVVMQVALVAAVVDLVFPGDRQGARFYWVMRTAERWDRWLSLYGAADSADIGRDGLFGASAAGSDTLLGKLEAYVTGRWEVDGTSEAKPGALSFPPPRPGRFSCVPPPPEAQARPCTPPGRGLLQCQQEYREPETRGQPRWPIPSSFPTCHTRSMPWSPTSTRAPWRFTTMPTTKPTCRSSTKR